MDSFDIPLNEEIYGDFYYLSLASIASLFNFKIGYKMATKMANQSDTRAKKNDQSCESTNVIYVYFYQYTVIIIFA